MNRLKQSLSSISTPALPSFGSSSSTSASERATEPPLEPARLTELAARQKLTSHLLDACSQLHRALAKERPDPRNSITIPNSKTKLPVEWLATIMTEGAEEMNASLTPNPAGDVESYGEHVPSEVRAGKRADDVFRENLVQPRSSRRWVTCTRSSRRSRPATTSNSWQRF